MTFTNTVLFVHTVNKAVAVSFSNVSSIYSSLGPYLRYNYGPLSVLPRQGENVKSTPQLSNLKCALKVMQKQQEINFVKCLHACKLFCSFFIALRWTRLYYCMRCLHPYELFCGAFSSMSPKTRLQSSVLLYFWLFSKDSLIVIWK